MTRNEKMNPPTEAEIRSFSGYWRRFKREAEKIPRNSEDAAIESARTASSDDSLDSGDTHFSTAGICPECDGSCGCKGKKE